MTQNGNISNPKREITLIRYVLKNIKRRRLRSALTIIGIAICITFFIVLAAISAGLNSYLMEEFEKKKEGVIFMSRPVAFSEDEVNTIDQTAEEHFEGLDAEYSIQPAIEWPFIREYGGGGFESYMEVYHLIGVGPDGIHSPWDTYEFDLELISGEHLNTIGQTEAGIVLGYKLWNDYYSNKSVGDLLDIVPINFSFHATPWHVHDRYLAGERNFTTEVIPAIRNVKLIGILEKAPDDRWYDYNGYLPMEFMLRKFKLYDEGNSTYYYPQVNLFIDDATGFDFTELEFKLRDAVPELDGWDNRFELSLTWLENMENTVSNWFLIIIAIISIVSIIGVSNTMIMSVTERRIELGTLRALGFSRGKIRQLIFSEAIIICLVAYAIAMALGVGFADYFDNRYDESLSESRDSIFFAPTEVNAEIVLSSMAIAVLFGTVAALYPAHRATKVHPVEALRYG